MNAGRFAIAVAVILAATAPGRADSVDDELAVLVTDVTEMLKDRGQKVVRVGKFLAGGDLPSNYGPNIQNALIREFAKHQIAVNKTGTLELRGSYDPVPRDPNTMEMFFRINVQIIDTALGKPLANVNIPSREVFGNEELARAFPVPVSLPPDGNRARRNEILRDAVLKPKKCHLNGAKVSTKAGSPFAVEILVVNDVKADHPADGRVAEFEDDLPFVRIGRGEMFRVRIHNGAPFDVGVKLSLDGLDQFVFTNKAFCDDKGKPRFTHMVIPAGKSGVINGWFRDLKGYDAFVVTEFAKSAAAELKPAPDDIGQIVAQFHAAWPTDGNPPADEGDGDKGSGDAIGKGPPGEQDLKEVERKFGVLRDTIAIRYTRK